MTRSLPLDAKATRLARTALSTALIASLAACSSINEALNSDKVDYRTAARQTTGLDVPPDLTQLARDNRSQVQGGTVSASALQQAAGTQRATATPSNQVALANAGTASLQRNGEVRWVRSTLSADLLWPQLRAFWRDNGFELVKDEAAVGVLETNWAENRAKLPQDFIRRTIGTVLDSAYSTGERDMYRTRVERAADGSTDIYISHRGMQEVYTTSQREQTAWQPRAADPLLEGEMLSRLMLKLGGKEEEVKTATAGATAPAALPSSELPASRGARNRPLSEVPDSLQVNDGFERAWRRVGQSLDRHGFTVEDRDRSQGLFFLRYADPTQAGKEEPNFFERLFKGEKAVTANRYRVAVKAEGERSTVTVLDSKGQQQTDENAKRILNLLMDDLR